MPTYLYKFVKTGETIEVHQAFTEPALTVAKHPTTGRRMAVKKVFTPVGVAFRGDGFYKTDSRGTAKKPSSTSSESTTGSSSDNSSGSSSDTSSSTTATKDTSSDSKSPAKDNSSSSSSSGSSAPVKGAAKPSTPST